MGSLPSEKKRKLLVKSEEEASQEHGCLPHKRSVEELLKTGITVIDKPPGPTSHQVSDWVKGILGAKRAGHSGTLDPNVTGVLPVGINNGTKVLQALLPAGKEYLTLMHLHEEVPEKDLKRVLNEFTGKIYQKPPVKSAVLRVLRTREIYYQELLETVGKDILFTVGCEAGTYIRRLCYDLGEALGTGAHMQQLKRTKTGPFSGKDTHILQDVADAYHYWKEDGEEKCIRKVVLPMESALAHFPRIIISDAAIAPICHGAQLAVPGILQMDDGVRKGDKVAVFTQKGEAVMLGTASKSTVQVMGSNKGIAVKTERVLMETDVYPRFKK